MPPYIKTNGSQCILKRETPLVLIPWSSGSFVDSLSIVYKPQPDKTIKKAGKHGDLFRSLAFIALRLFSPQILLNIAEGIFNSPAVSKGRNDLSGKQAAIGSKEKVIMFFAIRITGDDQKYRVYFIDGIPKYLTAVDQPLSGLPPPWVSTRVHERTFRVMACGVRRRLPRLRERPFCFGFRAAGFSYRQAS
jgi:hypothetical protein